MRPSMSTNRLSFPGPIADGHTSGHVRPFWSVMVPTYKRSEFLSQALESVLAQDPGSDHMQIEVVDNCSPTDEIRAVVDRVGRGRVGLFGQSATVSMVENWNTCLQRATGHWVHLLNDDDWVRPGFYQAFEDLIRHNQDVNLVFCRHLFANKGGHWLFVSPLLRTEPGPLADWLPTLAAQQQIMTPAIAVKRDVYELLGGFRTDLNSASDWEMWVRIAAAHTFWYIPEPLACYRMHDASESLQLARSGSNIRDTRNAIFAFKHLLPPQTAGRISRFALRYYASQALANARELRNGGDLRGAVAQVCEGLRCSVAPKVLWSLARFAAGTLRRLVTRRVGGGERV
jgi:glycosyltransferase involved in cell wall biosynthesis